MWRYWRCVLAQSFMKALLWIVLILAAGYAAYMTNECPKDQTCVSAPQKAKR